MNRQTRLAALVCVVAVLVPGARVRADIVVPTFQNGTDLNTDTGSGYDPANLTTNDGLSHTVDNGDSLASAQTANLSSIVSSNEWATNTTGGGTNYFATQPAPVFVWDLGKDESLANILLWQYNISDNNGNQARDFTLRYSTSAAGPTFSGPPAFSGAMSIFNSESGADRPHTFALDGATARYVELTLVDNYFGVLPDGGDRVGLGKIRFDRETPTPEPSSLVLGVVGGLAMLVLARRGRRAASAGSVSAQTEG